MGGGEGSGEGGGGWRGGAVPARTEPPRRAPLPEALRYARDPPTEGAAMGSGGARRAARGSAPNVGVVRSVPPRRDPRRELGGGWGEDRGGVGSSGAVGAGGNAARFGGGRSGAGPERCG